MAQAILQFETTHLSPVSDPDRSVFRYDAPHDMRYPLRHSPKITKRPHNHSTELISAASITRSTQLLSTTSPVKAPLSPSLHSVIYMHDQAGSMIRTVFRKDFLSQQLVEKQCLSALDVCYSSRYQHYSFFPPHPRGLRPEEMQVLVERYKAEQSAVSANNKTDTEKQPSSKHTRQLSVDGSSTSSLV